VRVQILTKTHEGQQVLAAGLLSVTQVKNQISSISQSAADIDGKISQCLLDCTGNKNVSIYSFMT